MTRKEIFAAANKIDKRLCALLTPFGIEVSHDFQHDVSSNDIIAVRFDFLLCYGPAGSRKKVKADHVVVAHSLESPGFNCQWMAEEAARGLIQLLARENK